MVRRVLMAGCRPRLPQMQATRQLPQAASRPWRATRRSRAGLRRKRRQRRRRGGSRMSHQRRTTRHSPPSWRHSGKRKSAKRSGSGRLRRQLIARPLQQNGDGWPSVALQAAVARLPRRARSAHGVLPSGRGRRPQPRRAAAGRCRPLTLEMSRAWAAWAPVTRAARRLTLWPAFRLELPTRRRRQRARATASTAVRGRGSRGCASMRRRAWRRRRSADIVGSRS
mmetsp:Transcript_3662/g.13433  ORF Transcript_3662/g.13433 Transcript_3662/m.13433 type:complete len:225 (+) Transcript_3662:1567-2241(+)